MYKMAKTPSSKCKNKIDLFSLAMKRVPGESKIFKKWLQEKIIL